MPITVTIADDLARKLKPYESEVPEILELGIRERQARGEPGFSGVRTVLEALAALPTPEQVLALRPTPPLQERLEILLERNRTCGLSTEEKREWEQYELLEHMVRTAKAHAARKLKENLRP